MAERIKLQLFDPEASQIKEIHLVGRYAVGVDWSDDHHSIYPFVFLRSHCPCEQCRGSPPDPLPEREIWPTEITRLEGGLRIGWQSGHETRYPGSRLREMCGCALCGEARKNR